MLVGNYEKFCKNFHLCEGYKKAINSSEEYFLHHIQGENISREELIEKDLYYDCEPEKLRWVTRSEHQKIHSKGENNPNFGKTHSDETRKKMSDAQKGKNHPNFGKKHSDETRLKISVGNKGKVISADTKKKMSEAKKGKPSNTKGKSWKLVDGKRIYSSSNN